MNFTINEADLYNCPILQAAEYLARQELNTLESFFNSLPQRIQDEVESIYVVLKDPGLLYVSHRDRLYTREAVDFVRRTLQEQILHCVNERRQTPQAFHATLSAEERAQQQRLTALRLNPPSNAVNVEPNYSLLIQHHLEWAATPAGQAYYFTATAAYASARANPSSYQVLPAQLASTGALGYISRFFFSRASQEASASRNEASLK